MQNNNGTENAAVEFQIPIEGKIASSAFGVILLIINVARFYYRSRRRAAPNPPPPLPLVPAPLLPVVPVPPPPAAANAHAIVAHVANPTDLENSPLLLHQFSGSETSRQDGKEGTKPNNKLRID